jgi:hypothetical protein
MLNIYLDSNIYIIGLRDPRTNSALILDALNQHELLVTQSDYLYDEVLAWFKSHEGKDMSGKVQMYMLSIKNKEYVNKFE